MATNRESHQIPAISDHSLQIGEVSRNFQPWLTNREFPSISDHSVTNRPSPNLESQGAETTEFPAVSHMGTFSYSKEAEGRRNCCLRRIRNATTRKAQALKILRFVDKSRPN
jgi:hypothetical protein